MIMRFWPSALAAAVLLAAAPLQAAPVLLGVGTIPAASTDLSGLGGTLEDGSPANLLGMGSAIAYSGSGNRFLVAPDRGPNAGTWNPDIDNTTSFVSRFHEVDIAITGSNGSYTVTPTLAKTTLLSDAQGTSYTGRSDNFATRFDPEGLRVGRNGQTVFISDEYGPYIREFDRSTGQEIRKIAIPEKFLIQNQSPAGATELVTNSSGRQANRGMEGLAITPDGKTLYGIMQSPLIQDNGLDSSQKRVGLNVRILAVDLETGTTKEYVYQLANKDYGVSEIVAINDHEFLVVERDGKAGSNAKFKQIVHIDITGATDVSTIASLPKTGLPAGVVPVTKTGFLDLLNPLYNLAGSDFPEKIEGIAFGPDFLDGNTLMHTLVVVNDNDFLTGATLPDGSVQQSIDNKFFVFGFTDADLGGYVPQEIPAPAAASLLLLGLFAMRRRRGLL